MKRSEGGAKMKKVSEYEVYNAFYGAYLFMQPEKRLYNKEYEYVLYQSGNLLSTNGRRLIKKILPISDDTFSIYKYHVEMVVKRFRKKRKRLYIDINEDEKNIYIDDLVIRKCPVDFPDWKKVYPDLSQYTTEINFRKSEMLNVIKEFSKISNKETTNSFVRIKLQKDNMQLFFIKDDNIIYQKYIESANIISLGSETINMCINTIFLIDSIKSCEEIITLKYRDINHPVYITDEKSFIPHYKENKTEILFMLIKPCEEI